MVRLRSRVTYAQSAENASAPAVVVDVTFNIIQPELVATHISNTFTFIFTCPVGTVLKSVYPSTPDEAAASAKGQQYLRKSVAA
jgi:hypothetical protein